MWPIDVTHRFFAPFSLFFRESELLREADKAAVRERKGRRTERWKRTRRRRLKGRTLGNREGAMREKRSEGDERDGRHSDGG